MRVVAHAHDYLIIECLIGTLLKTVCYIMRKRHFGYQGYGQEQTDIRQCFIERIT